MKGREEKTQPEGTGKEEHAPLVARPTDLSLFHLSLDFLFFSEIIKFPRLSRGDSSSASA